MTDAPSKEQGLLGGRYALDGLIGRGGMAEVYRAHDLVLGRVVAVKVLHAVFAGDAERARFTEEARTLARLSHPGLVTILDAAVSDDVPYQVMELVNGPTLADCCRAGPLEPTRVAAMGAQLADALGHVHAAGVVHRDIKPGNILLDGDDRARLTDFGIARLMSATARHTITGATIGTPAYLAPEQVRGEEVTPATDVYALGLVLIEALTGRRVYRGAPVEAALARLTAPPTLPQVVPPSWHGMLLAMTALEPAARPSTAAIAAALRGLASGLDPAAATAALRIGPAPTATAPAAPGGADGGRTDGPRTMELEAPRAPDRVRHRRRWAAGAVLMALVLTLVAVAVDVAGAGRGSERAVDLPANVPPGLEAPLRDLHEAGDAVPELRALLSQVDDAIVERRYALARALLDDLVDATVAARDAGRLDVARAEPVLAAAAALASALPGVERRAAPETIAVESPGARDGGDPLSVSPDETPVPPLSDEPDEARADVDASDGASPGDGAVEPDGSTTTHGKKTGKDKQKDKQQEAKNPDSSRR